MADRVNYKSKVDVTSTHKYIGEARPGTATSSSKWRIMRITLLTNDCEWAESGDFQVAWDDRVTAAYS